MGLGNQDPDPQHLFIKLIKQKQNKTKNGRHKPAV